MFTKKQAEQLPLTISTHKDDLELWCNLAEVPVQVPEVVSEVTLAYRREQRADRVFSVVMNTTLTLLFLIGTVAILRPQNQPTVGTPTTVEVDARE